MMLRRNKSGSWKLRVRVDQGGERVKRLIEMGLGTRNYKEACIRAHYALKLGVLTSITHQQGFCLSAADSSTHEPLRFDNIEQLLKQNTPTYDKPIKPRRI